jgi:hypothetical protein
MSYILTHQDPCRYYWGSHGCDLEYNHKGFHRCGGTDWNADPFSEDDNDWPCSEYDQDTGNVRYGLIDEKRWSEWGYHGSGWSAWESDDHGI